MRWFPLILVLLLTGCAERVLTRDELKAMHPVQSSAPSIVLAISESAPYVDGAFREEAAWDSQYDPLIRGLRESGLFKEVDMVGKTQDPPQFTLVLLQRPHMEHPEVGCGEAMILPIFTLGIIPMHCSFKLIASFEILDASGAKVTDLAPTHASGQLVGLVAYPARMSDAWAREYDYERFYEMVADEVYVAAQQTLTSAHIGERKPNGR
jgi:hypothetical protein